MALKKRIGRGSREQCRSVSQGSVKEKKMISRGPRELCVSFSRFGINNALQDLSGRKERNAKEDRERAESRSLCCFN